MRGLFYYHPIESSLKEPVQKGALQALFKTLRVLDGSHQIVQIKKVHQEGVQSPANLPNPARWCPEKG